MSKQSNEMDAEKMGIVEWSKSLDFKQRSANSSSLRVGFSFFGSKVMVAFRGGGKKPFAVDIESEVNIESILKDLFSKA